MAPAPSRGAKKWAETGPTPTRPNASLAQTEPKTLKSTYYSRFPSDCHQATAMGCRAASEVWVGAFRPRAAQLSQRARNRQGAAWKRRARLTAGVPAVLDRCCARRLAMFCGRGGSKPPAGSNQSKDWRPAEGRRLGRRDASSPARRCLARVCRVLLAAPALLLEPRRSHSLY
jgi:hypothetical protein